MTRGCASSKTAQSVLALLLLENFRLKGGVGARLAPAAVLSAAAGGRFKLFARSAAESAPPQGLTADCLSR